MTMMVCTTRPGTGSGRLARRERAVALATAALLSFAACTAPASTQAPEPSREQESEQPSVTSSSITLSGEPAAVYRTGEPLTAIDEAVAAEAARRMPALRFSSNLARAARELAGTWRGADIGNAPHELITFVLNASGCVDPSETATLVATTDPSSEPVWAELVATARSPQEAPTHVGIASARDPLRPTYTRWVMLLVDRSYTLEPLPRAVAADAAVRLRFGLAPGLRGPRVIAKSPHGAMLSFPVRAVTDDGGFEASLELGHDPGEHVVELLAEGDHGPQVLALFPISVAAPPPRSWHGEAPPPEDAIRSASAAEDYLRDLTDRQRRDNGRKELAWDPRLAAIARRHAQDMRDNNFMGHVSPTTGDIGNRLRRAEYPFSFAAENIARSTSLWEAVESLMRSPGHRRNLLATDPTHAGIGVAIATDAEGRRTFFVTQVFVRPSSAMISTR